MDLFFGLFPMLAAEVPVDLAQIWNDGPARSLEFTKIEPCASPDAAEDTLHEIEQCHGVGSPNGEYRDVTLLGLGNLGIPDPVDRSLHHVRRRANLDRRCRKLIFWSIHQLIIGSWPIRL